MLSDRYLNFRKIRQRKNGRHVVPPVNIIDLRNIVKVYDGGAVAFTALNNVDFAVSPGEFVSVVGKSGSGKSTLLNMITGIDRPTSGEVYVAGTPIHNLSEGKLAVWRGTNLGIVFQFFQLIPTLTVLENILLPMDFCKKYAVRYRKERALGLLEEIGLADQAYKLPTTLSGGQQQRAAIARALANDPPILVADEPTGNLDSQTAESIFQLFTRLIDKGKTILTVTHDREFANRASRSIFLSDGQIVQDTKQIKVESLNTIEIDHQVNASGAIDLVKSGHKEPITWDPEINGIVQNDDEGSISLKVKDIFTNRRQAVELLRDEFTVVSHDERKMELLYNIVLVHVKELSIKAEQANNPDEAREVWKILMEATEPWAKPSKMK